jgi:hypothetical protein
LKVLFDTGENERIVPAACGVPVTLPILVGQVA